MTIRVLTPETAAKIAAGEVVERPSSVVKELVENALDAGATAIAVEVSGGGQELIRVTDDGCGLASEELELAFARHATSKLIGDDLLSITTLGFRGEALPAIAAVAEVEIVSRPPDAQAAAYVRLDGGAVVERGERGAPAGTSVSVSRLFARQPARRKFLRSPSTEANHIASVVSHYALAYPTVRVALTLDGRQALLTDGNGELRDAIAAVYGADVAAAMLLVRPGDGLVAVDGLAAAPQVSRAGRGYVSLFVNGRWIQSRRLAYAVEEAYRGLLMVGRYPIAVLHLRLPLEEVDVNVHPTKAEVRFRDESAVFGAVQRAVRAALLETAPVAVATAAPTAPTAPPAFRHRPRRCPRCGSSVSSAAPTLSLRGPMGCTSSTSTRLTSASSTSASAVNGWSGRRRCRRCWSRWRWSYRRRGGRCWRSRRSCCGSTASPLSSSAKGLTCCGRFPPRWLGLQTGSAIRVRRWRRFWT